MLYPLSSESFPTKVRTLGFGWCSGIGRLGAAIIPYIIFHIMDDGGIYFYYPFLLFSCFSLIAAIASFTFPFDT